MQIVLFMIYRSTSFAFLVHSCVSYQLTCLKESTVNVPLFLQGQNLVPGEGDRCCYCQGKGRAVILLSKLINCLLFGVEKRFSMA